jgi:hypothetical protein
MPMMNAKRTRMELEKMKKAKGAELAKLKKAKAEPAKFIKDFMKTELCKKAHANADPKLTHKQAKRSLKQKPTELHCVCLRLCVRKLRRVCRKGFGIDKFSFPREQLRLKLVDTC